MAVDPSQTAAVVALIEAQTAAREQIRTTIMSSVTAQVRAFHGWWSSSQITGLAQKLARITSAGQRRTASSTDVYGSRILTHLLDTPIRPIGAVDTSKARGGVPLDSVYGRLADEYRWLTATRSEQAPERALAASGEHLPVLSPEQILDRVVRRAETQVDANLTIAMREQWSAVTDAAPTRVVGYRRVLHPELAKKFGTCGLCVVASDHVYKRGELLPIHDHCNCGVVAIVDEVDGIGDPGSAINQMDLNRLYEHAGSNRTADLRKTKYRLVQHDELGPILVFSDRSHRTAKQAEASATH